MVSVGTDYNGDAHMKTRKRVVLLIIMLAVTLSFAFWTNARQQAVNEYEAGVSGAKGRLAYVEQMRAQSPGIRIDPSMYKAVEEAQRNPPPTIVLPLGLTLLAAISVGALGVRLWLVSRKERAGVIP